jgi:hypothetical protein
MIGMSAIRTIFPCIILAQATMASGQGGGARVAPQYRPVGDIMFLATRDLDQSSPAASAELRHGRIADSRQWPASLYATFETPGGTAACTAAIVGPQAVLTAAHCVPDSGRITVAFAGRAYRAACEVHPQYVARSDDSADFGLCKTERPFAAPDRIRFETINTAPMDDLLRTPESRRILLSGYGCISDIIAEDETDGNYRIGFNTVEETSNSAERRRGDDYYAGREDNNLLTSEDPELANLCPGDSGGPAFQATNGSDGPYSRRSIVGVNSRVFYRDFDAEGRPISYGASLISATGGPEFRAWALAWAARAQVAVVCGLVGPVELLRDCRD